MAENRKEGNRLSGGLFLTLPSNFSVSSGGGSGGSKGGSSPGGSCDRFGERKCSSTQSRASPLHQYTWEDLRRLFLVSLNKMARMEPESLPFRQPVDVEELGIPDYHDIIRKPMDLQTIRNKMNTGKYTDPYAYVDDVLLMLDNAWLYNRPDSKLHAYTTRLSSVFVEEVNPVMYHLGYKQGRTNPFQYNSDTMNCHGRPVCFILRTQGYWRDTSRDIEFNLCENCYNEMFNENPVTPDVIPLGQESQKAFVFSVNSCKAYSPAAELHRSHVRDAEMSRQMVLREFLRLVVGGGEGRKMNVFKMLEGNRKLLLEFIEYVKRRISVGVGEDGFCKRELEGLLDELRGVGKGEEGVRDSGVESAVGSSLETLDLSVEGSLGSGGE